MAPKQNDSTGNYTLADYLLMLRSRAKLTQIELANRLGIHRRSIQKWESHEAYPTAENLRTLIGLLLDLQVFMPGQERDEAAALWRSVSQAAPQRQEAFDHIWFDRVVAAHQTPNQPALGVTFPAPVSEQPTRPPAPSRMLNLPFQPTPLIGRDAELTEIAHILHNPACRLLTLLGPGGIGKTRLALESAARQADAFHDGAVFVSLTAVSAPNQIVPAICEALNLTLASQLDPSTQLLGYLRTRQVLLVLDNFEHLLAGADLIYTLLAQTQHVTFLITSRERLNLQAEWLFNVEGLAYPLGDLTPPNTAADLAVWASYSAVQLFIQRVAQIQSGFPPPDTLLPTIGRICQHLAGMPLALELAAASVRLLPIGEIERQIRSNLDLLATSLRDVPARHRSLRAVFDQSWHLLSELERRLFSRLAIFRGGWTAVAAEQVTGATFPLLIALVDKSLVRAETQTEPSTNAGHTARFSLLEPLREYALEKLALQSEGETLYRAHAAYYLKLAETIAAQWESPTADTAIAQLDREYDNVRAALQWARDGGDLAIGLQTSVALRKFWQRRGLYNEGRAWLADFLAQDAQQADKAMRSTRARAMHVAAWLASDQHDFTQAAVLFEQSMAVHRALGEMDNETNLLTPAARQARAAGQYLRAAALLEEALARYRVLGDRAGIGTGGMGLCLYELGLVRREQGHFQHAATLFEECIAFHRTLGDREGVAVGLMGLSDLARDQGDSAGIRQSCEPSLIVTRELGLQWAIGFLLNNLALAAMLEGDLAQALTLATESLSLFRSLGSEASIAEVLITLGQIQNTRNERVAAYRALTEALRLASFLGPQLVVATALEGLANVIARPNGHQQDAMQAVQLLSVASALRDQMGTPVRPLDQPALAQTRASTRARLGETAYATVWAEATALTLEQFLSTLPSVAAFSALSTAANGLASA